MKSIPTNQKKYTAIIYLITIVSFIFSSHLGYIQVNKGNYSNVLFFIILTALAESVTVEFKKASFSTSFVITILTYVLFGPYQSIIILLFGFLFRVTKLESNRYVHLFNTPLYGTLFNCCAITLPMIVGNYFYILLGGTFGSVNLGKNIIQLIVFVLVYFVINVLIISKLMNIYTNKKFSFCFVVTGKTGFLNCVLMLPIGAFLAMIFDKYRYAGIICIVFSLFLVRYTLSLYSETKSQFIDTVEALMNAIDARDQYTQGHSRRVAEISTAIARELKYNQWDIEQLNVAAMLHDVGKIGISDTILNKPGKLTKEEYDVIKQHPEIGLKIIKDIKNIDYVYPIVRSHHERYDGKGYPDGKKGGELPEIVYIVQLADTVDAMESDRPYRKGLPEEAIIDEITKYSGTQFHPKVAETYLKILKENNGKLTS